MCKRSFKATSLRLKCAFQRAIANGEDGGGLAETGFLKYVVDPRGELADRVLPPPTFCTRAFDEDPVNIRFYFILYLFLSSFLLFTRNKPRYKPSWYTLGGGGRGKERSSSRLLCCFPMHIFFCILYHVTACSWTGFEFS